MSALFELRETVARLRAPGGCPWDREQTHQSICDCLIEECAELLESIDNEDMELMREELGDLLLHVVMHSQMASEDGHFDLEAVAKEVNEKMIRRHPHVFGEVQIDDSEGVLKKWDEIKAAEKQAKGAKPDSIFKALPPRLSSLLFAREVFKQIDKKSLPHHGIVEAPQIDKIADGLTEETAGELLFDIAAACRKVGVDPESALRRHTRKVMASIESQLEANSTNLQM